MFKKEERPKKSIPKAINEKLAEESNQKGSVIRIIFFEESLLLKNLPTCTNYIPVVPHKKLRLTQYCVCVIPSVRYCVNKFSHYSGWIQYE